MAISGLFELVLAVGLAVPCLGSRPSDPMVNVPLCNAVGYQGANGLTAVPSVAGGVIAAWQDDRDGDNDIYARRLSSGGPMWSAGGVVLSAETGNQRDPAIGSPRDGSVVIALRDGRDFESGGTGGWNSSAP